MSNFSYPISAVADASGNATIRLNPLFTTGRVQVWNLGCTIPGTNPQVQVLINLQPYITGLGPTPILGPVYSMTSEDLQLSITGATPNSNITAVIQGDEENTFDELPNLSAPSQNNVSINGGSVTLSGPVTISGSVAVQASPSGFVAGEVGTPLITNASGSIGTNGSFTSPVLDVTGFGAVLLTFFPSPSGTTGLLAILEFQDGSGNTVALMEATDCRFGATYFCGCLTNKVIVHIYNRSNTQAFTYQNLYLIPFVSLPNSLAPYYAQYGTAPASNLNLFPGLLMNTQTQSIVAGGSFTDGPNTSGFQGKVKWSVSNSSGQTNTGWWATLDVRNASGSISTIAHAGGVAMQTTQEVWLPPGAPSVTIHNAGGASANFDNTVQVM